MQVKKDELYQAILSNAEQEFFHKGFKGASLRQIAKLSGTTIGNLYHYFESKGALFEELVRDEYHGFMMLIENHGTLESDEPVDIDAKNISEWRKILEAYIHQLSPLFTRRFYILLDSSAGTRYENTRFDFIAFLEEHFNEHFKESHSHCAKELGGIIAEQILASLLAIVRDYEEPKKRIQLITEVLLFTIIGVMGILEY